MLPTEQARIAAVVDLVAIGIDERLRVDERTRITHVAQVIAVFVRLIGVVDLAAIVVGDPVVVDIVGLAAHGVQTKPTVAGSDGEQDR